MPLYFAYGLNLDKAGMAERCPQSTPLCAAKLMRHRLIIMPSGYASVLRDPSKTIHGALYDLALSDVAALDRFEGVAQGLYSKIVQPVVTEQGAKRALMYVGTQNTMGTPKAGYVEAVEMAAESWGLPKPLFFMAPNSAANAAIKARSTSAKVAFTPKS